MGNSWFILLCILHDSLTKTLRFKSSNYILSAIMMYQTMQIFNHWESETVLFGLLLGHMLSEWHCLLLTCYLPEKWAFEAEASAWTRGLVWNV